jgi:transcriptional regulator with XRE-family HTH domain
MITIEEAAVTYGKALRYHREKAKLTLCELARRSRVSVTTISNIETAKYRKLPSQQMRAKLILGFARTEQYDDFVGLGDAIKSMTEPKTFADIKVIIDDIKGITA